ncbi:MAG TPA: glycosyl transferase family protein, partial [Bryobacteraceae bacterium]|nr:glycosyl transferase family protein [Bryobacteraceae bacterium]
MNTLDAFVAATLVPLAIAAVISGLDDLMLDVWLAASRLRRRSAAPPPASPHKRIAVFVPLWQEYAVIGKMLRHNLETIRYADYDFFVGVYPNDAPTLDAVREIEAESPSVHLAIVPHDGPTSKADCLNWIYQGMLAYEEACGLRFDVVATHDAEDVIHPDGLRWISRLSDQYDMVQLPVLPLPTPGLRLTHGVYCDEFAEFQTKDVPARRELGGFLPSNGVGTGYSRRALEALAASDSNRVFDPACLTEDYDCGIRLHKLGFRQIFLPIRFQEGAPVATREYFPKRFRQAVRQRTRWVIGIALQGWERHGWRGGAGTVYWFWRDRKGLIGNPLSLLGNLVFLYGFATFLVSLMSGRPWALGNLGLTPSERLWLEAALTSQAFRLMVRAGCSARIYGWAFAAGVPVRAIAGNWINASATVLAILRYAHARLSRRSHAWLKTEHTYPAVEAPIQPGLAAVEAVAPALVHRRVARALPAHVVERWRVLPFRIAAGNMFLATPEEP